MDQRSEPSGAEVSGTEVERQQPVSGEGDRESREDVTPAASMAEQRSESDLSTADIAGERRDTSAEVVTAQAGAAGQSEESKTPLFPESDLQGFQTRWDEIQTGFVDDPRNTVQHADTLVAEVMQSLAQTFSAEQKKLEGQWERGADVSTEDLRVALQRYRSFFGRLLSV